MCSVAVCCTLRRKAGWQKHLRRGLHTLHASKYQLVYVAVRPGQGGQGGEGGVQGQEREGLKDIVASEVFRV